MKYTALLLLSLTITACATTKPANSPNKVDIMVSPVNERFRASDAPQGQSLWATLVDNDGNLYVSYWKQLLPSQVKLQNATSTCQRTLRKDLFFPGWLVLNKVSPEDINPSNYKAYVNCIWDSGFELNGSDAFFPKGYYVGLRLANHSPPRVVRLGGEKPLHKESLLLSDLYQDLDKCAVANRGAPTSAAEEKPDAGEIHISLEEFAKGLEACMQDKGYTFK